MTRPQNIDRGRLKLRVGTADDVEPLLLKYGARFFNEAGFGQFSTFDLERATREMQWQIAHGDTPFILADLDGEVVGMISWTMSHVFTAKPIALLWMFYVMPEHRRRGPVGRLLLWFAVDIARSEGACAFFATIPPTSPGGRRLCNLFRKTGFAPMGGAFTRAL